jgi:hypothetical protein
VSELCVLLLLLLSCCVCEEMVVDMSAKEMGIYGSFDKSFGERGKWPAKLLIGEMMKGAPRSKAGPWLHASKEANATRTGGKKPAREVGVARVVIEIVHLTATHGHSLY